MKFNYPTGNVNQPLSNNHQKTSPRQPIQFGDRGMSLEREINQSNKYYLDRGMAVIHKKPTPIQIVKVDYPKRSAAIIKEAYFAQASTTDYNGVYNGKYIDFDAKETKNKTAFPLSNFHQHQVEHMRQCVKQGGICFALIKFVADNSCFVFRATDLFQFWDQQFAGGRKSIPKSVIQERGIEVRYSIQPLIPYLSAVKQLIDS